MENNPLVSYIVPVYNSELYLERCIISLLNQTYRNIELILVDDGSSDNSGEICDLYGQTHSNVRVFHLQNGGASQARKYGLTCAKGDYIGFVDSDDFVDIHITEYLMQAMVHTQLSISACRVAKSLEDDKIIPSTTFPLLVSVLKDDTLMNRFFHYEFWGLCAKLYKKTVFKELYFPKATISEDYVVIAQLFLKEHSIAYVDIPMYHYRVHPGGLSTLKLSERKFEELENVAYVYNYVSQQSPRYKLQALANYTGTCVKLLSMVYQTDTETLYQDVVLKMRFILKKHFFDIVSNSHIYWKLKIVVIELLLFPKLRTKRI